jgi:hypothetical protein
MQDLDEYCQTSADPSRRTKFGEPNLSAKPCDSKPMRCLGLVSGGMVAIKSTFLALKFRFEISSCGTGFFRTTFSMPFFCAIFCVGFWGMVQFGKLALQAASVSSKQTATTPRLIGNIRCFVVVFIDILRFCRDCYIHLAGHYAAAFDFDLCARDCSGNPPCFVNN